jgi:hypothetical protein
MLFPLVNSLFLVDAILVATINTTEQSSLLTHKKTCTQQRDNAPNTDITTAIPQIEQRALH